MNVPPSLSLSAHSLSLWHTPTFTSCESPSVDPTNTTRLSRYARHDGAAVCRSKTDVTDSAHAQWLGSCDYVIISCDHIMWYHVIISCDHVIMWPSCDIMWSYHVISCDHHVTIMWSCDIMWSSCDHHVIIHVISVIISCDIMWSSVTIMWSYHVISCDHVTIMWCCKAQIRLFNEVQMLYGMLCKSA